MIIAEALTNWCADIGTQYLPKTWDESVFSLIPKAGKGGKIRHLRPIGFVSVLQKTAAACIIRKTWAELLCGSDAFAYRPGSGLDVAVMSVRLLIENARDWGEHIHVVKIEFSDAFRSIHYTGTWGALKAKLGFRRASPFSVFWWGPHATSVGAVKCLRNQYT